MANGTTSEAHFRRLYPIWYLVIPVVAYPPLLVAAQNPPQALLDWRRYVRPAVFPFPFEEQLLAITFAFVFIAGFALLFLSTNRLRLVMLGTALAAGFYPICGYICSHYIYISRPSPVQLSPVDMGFVMFLAAGCAINVLLHTMPAVQKEFSGGVPRPSFGRIVLFFAFGYSVLAIGYIYPLALIFVDVFPDISQMRFGRIFEPTHTPFFSPLPQLKALTCTALLAALYSPVIVANIRLRFCVYMTFITYPIYNLLTYVYVVLVVGDRSAVCVATDLSSCLFYGEHGWIFLASFLLSALIARHTLKYSGGDTSYPFPYRF